MTNIKSRFANALTKVPFVIYDLISKNNLFIAYYHMVNDKEVLHIKHLYPHKTVKQFDVDLDYILKYFKPISLADLLANQKQGNPLPSQALHLTFDDGFREMHDIVAPILKQKGIPATFFINSSFTDNNELCYQHKASIIVEYLLHNNISKPVQKRIEALLPQNIKKDTTMSSHILAIKYARRTIVDNIAEILEMDFKNYLQKHQPYLTTEQIRKLIAEGFAIGAHSIDHPLYANLALEEQLRQTLESVSFVKNTFNLKYGAFAFPHSNLGVSKKYFDEIAKSHLVDISFGTAGMIDDCVSNSIQRFSLEKPLMPVKNIFSYQSAKRLWRIINRNNVIKRADR